MEKMLQARVQIKRDTEANWNNVASTFVPKAGEFIVYVMTRFFYSVHLES